VKVTMVRSPGTAWDCKLSEGQTGTVDNLTGKRLVAAGIAVEIAEPKPVIEMVPPKPAIAEAKPAAIVAPAKETPAASEADKPKTSRTTDRGQKPKAIKES